MAADDRDRILAQYDVSRETSRLLDIYVEQLTRWQAVKNLVGPGTLSEVWTRHVADALQLLDAMPNATRWLDLGSGAGIPGLILAIAGRDREMFHVKLLESNSRKCAFLTETARLTGAPATIINARIETVIDQHHDTDVVCARALASLDQLLAWTEPLLKTGITGLFPKGRDASAELTEAVGKWSLTYDSIPSRTDPQAQILRITALSRRDS
ncbi:16S rRNA (guanine(527)-N(7))-methyltransferase RsmG [Methylobacterium brachythecii]|uniref:Ribosomal RNA small subunit methyltransferase G n=1 Tax=Methylobacterium brachythecii TaxID=1176177 RepID=A0A7W6ADR8_9HYPH|nr:16S rRNA (guanine(527)-N(7))-methyltransferase RsmG [Methylobacterium brachythecii]MBB3900838.1 16S rRNA (guanine527-N7)-methyltransferase [Methylobacterium brachythecii]GLS46060.1 ribosomal RNA small subunit methyltransferase G [Methylobacterium brachythecii]